MNSILRHSMSRRQAVHAVLAAGVTLGLPRLTWADAAA